MGVRFPPGLPEVKIMVANKIEIETNKQDVVKWILSTIMFLGALVAFYYFDQYPLMYRVLGLIGIVILGFLIVFNTEKIRSLRVFTHDARVELKKVIWSTKAEVIQTTVIVFVVVIIMSILLWLLDKLLGAGIKFLLA